MRPTPAGGDRAWLLAWFGFAAVAVANGGFRERVLVPRLGTRRAHQVSTGTLVATIAGGTAALQRLRPLPDRVGALRVGLGWSAGTLVFELAAGAVRRVPVSELVADYDLREGRVWGLVPLTMAVAPVLVERTTRPVRRQAGSGSRTSTPADSSAAASSGGGAESVTR